MGKISELGVLHQNRLSMHNFTFAQCKKNVAFFLAVFFAALLFAKTTIAQLQPNLQKIDPVFQAILRQRNLPESARTVFAPFKVQPTEGYAYRGAPLEKRYNCFVYTTNGRALRDSGLVVNSVLPSVTTVWVTLEQLERLSTFTDVRYIEAPGVDELHNDVSVASSGAALLHAGRLNNTPYKGKGVIVAVYDSGIDWDHPDFRNPADPTKSRILRIWDQTITAISGETPPTGYSYGVEYTQAHINNELDGSPANYVRQQDINGHGTHVAGTAAGNGSAIASGKHAGLAPEAELIIIKGGNGSFPQSNTVDAITYLQGLANTLGKPIVFNMSIGGQGGPHDGTLAHEQAANAFSASGPGRVVVISAGNDNGSNIHNSFTLAPGASTTVSFTVPTGTTGSDVFQYSVFAAGGETSSITAVATAPNGDVVTSTGSSTSGQVMTSSFNAVITNALYPTNGGRYASLYISRVGSNTTNPVGTWTFTLTNTGASTLTMHGWLHYRSSAFSATALVGGNSQNLVGSPGNSTSAITVASYIGRLGWFSTSTTSPGGYNSTGVSNDNISSFSAIGPRRDGVQKPEIAAVGQNVISSTSSNMNLAASSTSVVVQGLYHTNSGTSMAAPGTTGAVALLLQAKPTATASEIKSLLTANAAADARTGPVPNATWGYGKLDVFKAAAVSFNCNAVDRKTYQYEGPYNSTQDVSVALTTQQVAVRFTPDLSGKLGGVYYHSVSDAGAGGTFNLTGFTVEIRANNAGSPGTLLGTLSIPVSSISKFSWNYLDVSSLNISVTSGTDYFAVLYADAGSNWGIRRHNTVSGNRSHISTNGGVSWANANVDYRIRSVVFNNGQLSGTLAGHNSSDTRNINTSFQLLNNCDLIAQLLPNGSAPLEGNVTGKVWIEPSVPYYGGQPFVTRHYEITPATNATIASGRVTLYFTQAEFDAFNNDPGSAANLPADGIDATGKEALRVVKFGGNSSNGSGLPDSYAGPATTIDPDDNDIVWNAEQSRWEVTFNNTGFSGFIIQTTVGTLPIRLEYFTGRKQGGVNVLNWKAECGQVTEAEFDILRSSDGTNFKSIGKLAAGAMDCSKPNVFTDANPLPGKNYYRLRITENRSVGRLTNIILLQGDGSQITLYPTLLPRGGTVQVTFTEDRGTLTIVDGQGKQVLTRSLRTGVQNLSLDLRVSGTYHYSIRNSNGVQRSSGKVFVH